MGPTTRRRLLPPPRDQQTTGTLVLAIGTAPYSTTVFRDLYVVQPQTTVSEGNPWHLRKHTKGVRENIGSEFYTERRRFVGKPTVIDVASVNYSVNGKAGSAYRGPVFLGTAGVKHHSAPWPYSPLLYDGSRLLGQGTEAIARTIPTNPVADVAVFLGELREGLPKIVGSQLIRDRGKNLRRNAGGEYLNVEFGWKPLIADMQKFADATRNSEKYLAQLRRDSGRNVRRRYTFPMETVTTQETIATGNAAIAQCTPAGSDLVSMFRNPERATLVETTKSTREVWFSGCYSYYLDPGDDAMGKVGRAAAEANKLYGVRLTPETLWNLAPWSWAIDWVTNIGDIIHNLVAFSNDGLVLRYGYVMEKSVRDITRTLSGLTPFRGTCPQTISQTIRVESKRRIRASPYGFDVDWPDFTNRQIAIVSALGMTQGRSKRT